MDMNTKLSYARGTLPDRYWNQLNGQSAQDNYKELVLARQDEEDEFVIRSEVSVK